ncbi:hypothetical protein QUB63_10560 [Microcoleus sp. ARI1-B5]|uniref:hypothetical protein n=1 Tax=unclassified Microcoleus TaxID=2642155 RepID=UPI002FCF029B
MLATTTADRIFVMKKGEIVPRSGTHAELVGKRGLYQYLWNHCAIASNRFAASECESFQSSGKCLYQFSMKLH